MYADIIKLENSVLKTPKRLSIFCITSYINYRWYYFACVLQNLTAKGKYHWSEHVELRVNEIVTDYEKETGKSNIRLVMYGDDQMYKTVKNDDLLIL